MPESSCSAQGKYSSISGDLDTGSEIMQSLGNLNQMGKTKCSRIWRRKGLSGPVLLTPQVGQRPKVSFVVISSLPNTVFCFNLLF